MKAMKPISEWKHFQEDGSLQKDDSAYEEVEDDAAPYGTEAASAADPSLSEDDEWLYSKAAQICRKNLPMSRKIDGMIARYHDLAGLMKYFDLQKRWKAKAPLW